MGSASTASPMHDDAVTCRVTAVIGTAHTQQMHVQWQVCRGAEHVAADDEWSAI